MQLTIIKPDDGHLHLRDGAMMQGVLPFSSRAFARAVVMPNLAPPVLSIDDAAAYRQRLLQATPSKTPFQPLMTLYLSPSTTMEEILKIKALDWMIACKLYPSGATTNSEHGVSDIEAVYPLFEGMEEADIPLCIHCEDPDPAVDPFEKEARFIDQTLVKLVARFPRLRIVFEHVSTAEGIDFVDGASDRIAGSLTIHHMLFDRRDLFQGGLNPHLFCYPILKRKRDRIKVAEAAVSGSPKYFLGTDSAPHPMTSKHAASVSGGVFSSPVALPLYVELFEKMEALDRFEAFASKHMADFYGLPRNKETITLVKETWQVPAHYTVGDVQVVPMLAGQEMAWRIA